MKIFTGVLHENGLKETTRGGSKPLPVKDYFVNRVEAALTKPNMNKTEQTIDEMIQNLRDVVGRLVENDDVWEENNKENIRLYLRDEIRRAKVPMPKK